MATKKAKLIWMLAVCFRFAAVLLPLPGYIHPDEHFQSTEITSRDIFQINSLTTWEFNKSSPARSVVTPYSTSGIPYLFLKWTTFFNLTEINARNLIIFPRVFMSILLLIVDMAVFQVLQDVKKDPWPHLATLSTSYVTLVLNTKPFSNVVESVLFIVLILLTTKCYHRKTSPFLNSFIVGAVVAFGFFCRPTFLAFAFIPCLMWLYVNLQQIKHNLNIVKISVSLFKNIVFLAISAILTALMIVFLDMKYFQSKSFILTPWNIIKYNLMHAHEHGDHPRLTHLLVNLPLLYGPMALLIFQSLIRLCLPWDFFTHLEFAKKNKDNSPTDCDNPPIPLYKFLVISIIVPVCLISLVSHQEPRYISPVLIPLCILFGDMIYGENSSQFIKSSWIIWNTLGFVIFGIFHQGGVVPCLSYLQNHISMKVHSVHSPVSYHVVFFHTYMPPRSLLSWPEPHGVKNVIYSKNKLEVHDLAGNSQEILQRTVDDILKKENSGNFQIFLACPETVNCVHKDFKLVKNFFPHLTLEDPPDFDFLFATEHWSGSKIDVDLQNCKGTKTCPEIDCTSFETWTSLKTLYKCMTDLYKQTTNQLSLNLFKYHQK